MEIRTAQETDIDQIDRLYPVLFTEMHVLQPSVFQAARQDKDFLRAMIAGPESAVLLAETEGRILGIAVVQQQKTPPYHCLVPHTYAYLMDLVVAPGERSRGTGTALLAAVKAWARDRGLDYVELNVLHENIRAYQLYLREGFTPAMHTMRYWLEEDCHE